MKYALKLSFNLDSKSSIHSTVTDVIEPAFFNSEYLHLLPDTSSLIFAHYFPQYVFSHWFWHRGVNILNPPRDFSSCFHHFCVLCQLPRAVPSRWRLSIRQIRRTYHHFDDINAPKWKASLAVSSCIIYEASRPVRLCLCAALPCSLSI